MSVVTLGEAQRHETRKSKAPAHRTARTAIAIVMNCKPPQQLAKLPPLPPPRQRGMEGGAYQGSGASNASTSVTSTKTTKTLPFASAYTGCNLGPTPAVSRDSRVSSSYHTGVVVCDHAPEDHRHHHHELQHRGQSYDTGTRRQYESRSKLTLPSCRVDLRSKLRNSSSVRHDHTVDSAPHSWL